MPAAANPEALRVTERAGGLRLEVRVKPRSSRNRVLGVLDGALNVALTAPPVGGEANASLVKLLAKRLRVRRADVAIVSGASGRRKVIEVTGLGRAALLERLVGTT